MKKVRVAQWGGQHIVYLPIFAALQRGCFQDLGLKIELYSAGNDDEVYQEVVEGRADFGIGDPTFVALNKKKEVCVIAAVVNKVSTWGFTHHPEIHPIKTLDDLVGLRFGVFPKPSTSTSLINHLKEKGGKRLDSMEIVESPIGTQTALLANGRADIVLEIEPMVSIAAQQGLRVVVSLNDFFPSLLYTGVTCALPTIKNRAEIAEKFVKGLQLGLNICNREPKVLLDVARNLFPAVSDSCMAEAIERMRSISAWPEQALVQISSWQRALELRQALGELGSIKDPTEYLEQSFAYQAVTN